MVHIKSVPYKVSLRWLFYRLLQDEYYVGKDDYKKKWVGLASLARKRFYGEWRPNTIVDDHREIVYRVGHFKDQEHMRRNLDDIVNLTEVSFSHFYGQTAYVVIGFEAHAMVNQFLYHTEGINLIPFGGDVSIPLKWEIAAHLARCARTYQKPLRLLYFGDYDKKGKRIFMSAIRDIQDWCHYPIDFQWCGLTKEQAEEFALPKNPERPEQYQWEALTEFAAEDIITRALVHYRIDTDLIRAKSRESDVVTHQLRKKVRKALVK